MDKIELFLQQEIQKPKNWVIKEFYERKNFSNEELLYLFPNNKLKRFGLPMKKGGLKKKRIKRQMIRSQHLFNIIEDVFEDTLGQYVENEFFQKFVDFRDIDKGDTDVFDVDSYEDNYKSKWEEIKYEYRTQTRYPSIDRLRIFT